MPQVSRDVIPDISMLAIVIELAVKYDTILKPNMINTSVIGLTRIKLKFLNAKLVIKPKIRPSPNETTASSINWPIIMNGVAAVSYCVSSDLTVLYSIIDTMSLKTPSPKHSE